MSASYPGSVKTFTTRSAGQTIEASHLNDLQDEVNAVEAALLNGPLTLSGGQVKFPAAQNASTDANTLDDYEENSWTPTIIGTGGGAATYTTQYGTYTKIGQQVFAQFHVVTAGDGTLAGNLQLGGLPFTVNNLNASYRPTSPVVFENLESNLITLSVIPDVNATTATFYGIGAAGVSMVVLTAINYVQNTATFSGQLSYRASA